MHIIHYAQEAQKLLSKIETRQRKTNDDIAALHKLLAAGVNEYGKEMGLDDATVAQFVIPKDPR
jgi:hypothetical protein